MSSPPNGADHAPLIFSEANLDLHALSEQLGAQIKATLESKGLHGVHWGIAFWTNHHPKVEWGSNRSNMELAMVFDTIAKDAARPKVGG